MYKNLITCITLFILFAIPFTAHADYYGRQTEGDGFVWYRVRGNSGQDGAQDVNGNTLIPAIYDLVVYHETDGGWFGTIKNQKHGVYTSEGRKICDAIYDAAYYRSEDDGVWIRIEQNGKTGALDAYGNVIVTPSAMYNDSFFYTFDGFNYKNSAGEYVPLGIFLSGRSASGTSGTGNAQPSSSASISSRERVKESNGFVWYKIKGSNGLYGAQDENGNMVIPMKYDRLYHVETSDGWFCVIKGSKEGVYTNDGHMICDAIYDDVLYLHEDDGIWVKIVQDGNTGAIDYNGNVIVRPNSLYNNALIYVLGEFKYKNSSGNYVGIGISLRGLPASGASSAEPSSAGSSSVTGVGGVGGTDTPANSSPAQRMPNKKSKDN